MISNLCWTSCQLRRANNTLHGLCPVLSSAEKILHFEDPCALAVRGETLGDQGLTCFEPLPVAIWRCHAG